MFALKKKKKKKKKKKMTPKTMMPFLLPPFLLQDTSDLFLDVIITLPLKCLKTNEKKLKYLMRLRCVSKSFLNLTNDPNFINYYNLHYKTLLGDDLNFIDTTRKYSSIPGVCLSMSPDPGRCFSSDQWRRQWLWRFHILFKGSNFIYLQKRHELIPFHCPNHKKLIGSINGLICFGGLDSLEVYNILAGTSYYLNIPHSICGYTSTPDPIFAFGYDPISNYYKILRFHYPAIYSFRTNSWKQMYMSESYGTSFEGQSVCIKGIIYWPPGKHEFDLTPSYYTSTDDFDLSACAWTGIVLFDVHQEKFREIELPEDRLLLPTQYADIQLLSYRGYLAFAFINRVMKGTTTTTTTTTKSRKEDERGSSDSGIQVVLFMLKRNGSAGSKGEKVMENSWIKETIDLPISPPKEACIVSCFDAIFMGWFEAKHLLLYHIHSKSFFNLPLSQSSSDYYPKVLMSKKKNDPTYIDNLSFDFSLV